jgi:glucose-1-phosphate cytidylyltransferase
MEETEAKPKPMVLLDHNPILWHIMKIFAIQGFDDFLIATGYKHEVIDTWVRNLDENWRIETLFTGEDTQTGGRVKRCLEAYSLASFIITYGDGVANVNVRQLIEFHRNRSKVATVTAVRPPARFGVLDINEGLVTHFGEKLQTESGWINGGFIVSGSQLGEFISGDDSVLEAEPLPRLAEQGQLAAYKHYGFWHPMDTLRERNVLADLAKTVTPPWFELSI